MPRPTEQGQAGLHGNDAFTPSGASNFTTQVVAPLDVDAAPTQALALAKALGHANDAAQPILADRARQAGMNDEALGEAARASGQSLEEARAGHNYGSGFAVGYTKIDTQMRAFSATQEAQSFAAANPNMLPNELAGNIDGIFKKHFPNGEEQNPEAARAMSPILTHTIQEITGQRNLQIIKGTQQQAEDVITGQLVHDAQNNTNLFNRDEALTTLGQVYGPDKRGALSALVHSVGAAGVSAANPDLIRKILPTDVDFGGGVRLRPEDQHYLDAAVSQATEAQARANKAVVNKSEDNITGLMLNNKDPMAALKEYIKLPGANSDWAMHAVSWYYQRGKERDSDALENSNAQFEMVRAIARGDITTPGQLPQWLQDNYGVTGGKAGTALLSRGMTELGSSQRITENDPDYRTGLALIERTYQPGRGPLGQILNQSANQQQAGAMSDYRNEYNSALRNGKSSTDAALSAQKAVQEKWGDPVENPTSGNLRDPKRGLPANDRDQAQAVTDAWKNPGAFHASGIQPRDVDRLLDAGMISREDAKRAHEMYLQQNQHQ